MHAITQWNLSQFCYIFVTVDLLHYCNLLQAPPMTLDVPQFPDLRVSTITAANMNIIQQAGAWRELQHLQAAPTFQHMQVSIIILFVIRYVS